MSEERRFQKDNVKYSKTGIMDIYNPDGFSFKKDDKDLEKFNDLKDKWKTMISYWRKYPDHLANLYGIKLHGYQRLLLRIIFRYRYVYIIASRGSAKCVSEDTILFTKDGIKEIGSLVDYDKQEKEVNKKVELLNGFNETSNTDVVFINGKQKTKKVSTEDGYEIEGTYNHPILVMNDDGNFDFKQLQDIKIGDYVAISRGGNIWGNKTEIDVDMQDFIDGLSKQAYNTKFCNIPKTLTKDIARYIGLLIGDGCLSRNNIVIFTNIDKELIDCFKNTTKDIFNLEVKSKGENDDDFIIHSKFFREYLNRLGLKQTKSNLKTIPQIILDAPKEIISSFLQGLFDTDGTVANNSVSYCTASEKLSKQIQMLLLNYGIISHRVLRYDKTFKTYHYIINIYNKNIDIFNKDIGFGLKRKQDKLDKICGVIRNVNKDIIPYQQDRITRLTDNNKYQNTQKLKYSFHNVRIGDNRLTYYRLSKLYDYNLDIDDDWAYLDGLYNLNYYWVKVNKIEDNENYVYDVSVPDNHTFVGNGFVNHNSFLSVLALFLQCILYPRLKVGMTAGGKEQAVGIIKEKVNELKEYPLLAREIKRIENNKDHYSVHFQNGSVFKVAIAGEATRGKRFNRLLLDENRLIKKEIMETILIPTLIIKRQLPNGTVDPDELNHQELYLTSAYLKAHDCYKKFISFTKDMVKKDNVFVCAFGWEIPVMYGLFDEEYLQELKEKDDYNPLTHAMEYEAKFIGISDNAFFNLDEILQCRVHKLPELKKDEKSKEKDVIYVAGVDIARAPDRSNWANDLTSISVLKCVPKKDGSYISTLVYQRTLQGIHFQDQANIIRRLVTDYDLRAIAMDVKGISGGLLDFLNIPYGDFPPIVSMNDDLDKPLIQDGALPLIYKINPSLQLNSEMYLALQSSFRNGKLKLLIDKNEGEKELNKLKKADEDISILMLANYVETDALINELMNLEYTMSGTAFRVETASRSIRKDRVSSLLYANWYVRLISEENKRSNRQDEEFYCFYD
jgi:ribonucleoside-diphosphate reductase alpha chain